MNEQTIDAAAVESTFLDCLFRDKELIDGTPIKPPVIAEGILTKAGFHPDRLEQHRDEVTSWLRMLPIEFQSDGGGGWSFLNACDDRNGVQWTGEHRRMDQLFILGIGLGIARWLLPRNMWSALPGGMPYVIVDVGEPVGA
jgi:hypothetical protein